MKFTIEISQEDILAIISRAHTQGTAQNIVAEVTAGGDVNVKPETRGRPVGSKNINKPAAVHQAEIAAAKAPEAPKPAAAPVAAPAATPPTATIGGSSLTLQDISKALTEKAQKSGDRDGVLAILRKYAPTVSQVKPEQYGALMAELNGHGAEAVQAPAAGDGW